MKPKNIKNTVHGLNVATVLTVYGIETDAEEKGHEVMTEKVATVLTVYGIETKQMTPLATDAVVVVATVLTVYGIETRIEQFVRSKLQLGCNSTYRLRY